VRAELAGALLLAPALLGACQGSAEPANKQPAAALAPAPPSPAEVAQRMVRQQLGAASDLRFAQAQVFDSAGATIVCGRVAEGAQPEQRYIAVGEQDVFLENRMEPGHMDQAVTEFCRNS